MASTSPTADRIAREHTGRSGEAFERVNRGTDVDTFSENWGLSRRFAERPCGDHCRLAGSHGHGP